MALSLANRLRNFKASRENEAEAAAAPLVHDLLGGCETTNEQGTHYAIRRTYPEEFELPAGQPERLLRNLRLLRGVGPKTEEKLRALGFASLTDLLAQERWVDQVRELLRAIGDGDLRQLRRRGAADRDILGYLSPDDLVCVDIETTGLYSVLPLFLVGLFYREGGRLCLHQFLARRFEEERSVLVAVAAILPRFKAVVTYNGRAFDLPYLAGRFLAHRIPCAMSHFHLDLLHHARRKYRGSLPDCRLSTVEKAAGAGGGRRHDVDGRMIPALYHQFVKTQDQSLIREIVEHNALDLRALVHLIKLAE